MYTENPLMYMAGSLIDSPDSIARIDGNLSLRIHPIGTYMLYDESVLLCGMPLDKFAGVTQPFVITYERVSRHNVQGVGCHVLVSADSLKTKETLQ